MPPLTRKRKALEAINANVDKPSNAKKPKATSKAKAKPETSSKTAEKKPAEQPASEPASEPPSDPKWDHLLRIILKRRSERWEHVSGSKNLDVEFLKATKDHEKAFEFKCICNPVRMYEEDQDEEPDKSCDNGETCPCEKPAASLPSHPTTMTEAGVRRTNLVGDMMNIRNPDFFAMYTFNRHMAYGAMEVVHNMLLDFDDLHKNKHWRAAWGVVEGMVMGMLVRDCGMIMMADDGYMVATTAGQIARMVLTMFAVLEKEGHLHGSGSPVRNLGWIISLYLKMVRMFRESSVLHKARPIKTKAFRFEADNLDLYLLAYAHRHRITVPGVADVSKDADITMPKTTSKDPWGWSRALAELRENCVAPVYAFRGSYRDKLGGDALDITTWGSEERKEYNFDNKDPLPADTLKKLEEGLVFVIE